MDNPTKANIEGHIGFLDALRGFLAFWVFYGHLKMASIAKDVLWGSPALAVDGFMQLSGFLMV
jgi:peptidoglycan/LPS O-acetylase OafA/YrhL